MSEQEPTFQKSWSAALQRPEAIWILAANVIPVVGVLYFGWQAFALLIFYWIENVVIGVFNLLKVAVAGFTKPGEARLATLFLVPFFCVHYGLFCYVHGIFLLAMLTFGGAMYSGSEISPDAFDLVPRVWMELSNDSDLALGVVGLVGLQLVSFLFLWLGTGKWRTVNPMRQMFEPYGRIIVLHLTIFVATIPVLIFGEAMIAVLVLALMKCGLELGLPQFAFGLDKLPGGSADKGE